MCVYIHIIYIHIHIYIYNIYIYNIYIINVPTKKKQLKSSYDQNFIESRKYGKIYNFSLLRQLHDIYY